MSRSLMLDFHRHILEVRLWTATSKLSTRSRYDQPKAFRLPCLSEEILENPGAAELLRDPSRFPDVSHEQQLRNFRGRSTKSKQHWGVPMELSLASVQSSDNNGKKRSPPPLISQDCTFYNVKQITHPSGRGKGGWKATACLTVLRNIRITQKTPSALFHPRSLGC